jgi:hypothetical protein
MTTESELSPRFQRGTATRTGEAEPGAIRPDRLTVWPTEDGYYGIDVRWHGRECILRAVVVRRLLAEAGIEAQPGNSQDGRLWELQVGPVSADQVANVIESYIW